MHRTKNDIEWKVFDFPVPYPQARTEMEALAEAIINGQAPQTVWIMQHPACYTAGTSSKAVDLLEPRFPVYETGRGGEYTYHGPGQLVVYPMLDLKRFQNNAPDLRAYVAFLEDWIIKVLKTQGIAGERRAGRVGIWVQQGASEAKIAAIGVRVRKWVTFHGWSLNVNPNLADFTGIVPCGISQFGVTSLEALGKTPAMADVITAVKECF